MTEAAVKLSLGRPLDPEIEQLKEHVAAYLKRLRFADPDLIEDLASECLDRASGRERWDLQRLLRRALEEAQRRLDLALAQGLGLRLPEDAAAVTAARAALLLTQDPVCADDLIRPSPERSALLARLKAHLPLAIPPEVPGAMPIQDLEFWV
ncbi:MAG: hypothetical protein ACK4JF_03985 [Methylohalobius sp.]